MAQLSTLGHITAMTITEHLKFSIYGFSGKRVGLILAFASIALIPTHPFISCEASEMVAAIGFIILCLTAILAFIVPRGTPHKFRAVAFSLFGYLGHILCSH